MKNVIKTFRIENNLLNLVEKCLKDSKYNFSDLVNAAIMNFISTGDIERSKKKYFIVKRKQQRS